MMCIGCLLQMVINKVRHKFITGSNFGQYYMCLHQKTFVRILANVFFLLTCYF